MSNRDNNLNLIRFVAAFAVIVSHAYVLSTGKLSDEPLRPSLGMSLGDIAVDIFFTISGFLVVGSLLRKRDGLGFLKARAMRIFPALVAMIVGCVFLLGPLATTLPLDRFFGSKGTWIFVFRNLSLVQGVEFHLPGLFSAVPWPGIVNGSLWTLVYEVRLYLSLAVIWWLVRLLRADEARAVRVLCAVVALGAGFWQARLLLSGVRDIHDLIDPVPRLVLMFYSGACWRLWGGGVSLDGRWAAACAAVCAAVLAMAGKSGFLVAYELALPYVLWWVSYIPDGAIRRFNKLGDASYGIYIYSFPLQQLSIQAGLGWRPVTLVVVGGTAIVALGFASWHLLEKRFLETKSPAPRAAALP